MNKHRVIISLLLLFLCLVLLNFSDSNTDQSKLTPDFIHEPEELSEISGTEKEMVQKQTDSENILVEYLGEEIGAPDPVNWLFYNNKATGLRFKYPSYFSVHKDTIAGRSGYLWLVDEEDSGIFLSLTKNLIEGVHVDEVYTISSMPEGKATVKKKEGFRRTAEALEDGAYTAIASYRKNEDVFRFFVRLPEVQEHSLKREILEIFASVE